VQAALSIAETLKEKLVIANIGETQEDWRAPETGGIKVQLLQARMAELALPPRLGFLNERLLVIARGLLECSAASLLAARLKVPVLITGSQPE
jgi:hypothetical protein